jgi:hypothetical protein
MSVRHHEQLFSHQENEKKLGELLLEATIALQKSLSSAGQSHVNANQNFSNEMLEIIHRLNSFLHSQGMNDMDIFK